MLNSILNQISNLPNVPGPELGTLHQLHGDWHMFCFSNTTDLSYITEAISAYKQAVNSLPDDHPNMPDVLSSLGGALLEQFECTGNLSAITEATTIFQKAVDLTPPSDISVHHG